MMKHPALTLIFYLLQSVTYVSALKYCYEGTYEVVLEDGYIWCDLCPEGTYMPEYDHQHRACFNCAKRSSDLEVVQSPCTRKHDAVITCLAGYYRDLEKATCKKCTECENTGLPCQTYSDTICCMYENSEVVLHKDGFLTCRERPYLCRKGQYMETSVNECSPCPSNTFMPLEYHLMTECWKCPHYNLPLHSEIIQPCNSTHAPVVACEEGFYLNHAMGYNDKFIGCSPCTDCKKSSRYEGRACDGIHDTVCCPQPNMTVLDIPDGSLCERLQLGNSSVECCGEDTSPITNSTCRPCQTESYMNSTNHTIDACENCTACKVQQGQEQQHTETTQESDCTSYSSSETMWSYILQKAITFIVNFSIFSALLLLVSLLCYCRSPRSSYRRANH